MSVGKDRHGKQIDDAHHSQRLPWVDEQARNVSDHDWHHNKHVRRGNLERLK